MLRGRVLGIGLPLMASLALAGALGLASVRDFGLTWDEPLFYEYADSISTAYSIADRLAGTFDLERALGQSDHRLYGPAYLLLARPAVRLLGLAGLDRPDAWHAVNFLLFLLGAASVYLLCRRWMAELPAVTASLLFVTQPVLWGHAFINPKDIPFTVFFTVTVLLGFRMVDRLAAPSDGSPGGAVTSPASPGLAVTLRIVIAPAVALGLTTAIRVLGPLAGLLVVAHALLSVRRRALVPVLAYLFLAAVTTFVLWPYLWESPITRFFDVLTHMARNPVILPVLFAGDLIPSNELPASYLPTILGSTLTLPAIALGLAGLVIAARRIRSGGPESGTLALTILWIAVPTAAVLLLRPTMYDGVRHFLFVLPPLFLTAGLAIAAIAERLPRGWPKTVLASAILLPGIVGIARLHPYAYAYFNELAGGPAGAFREHESDYWLMCYKDGIEAANRMADGPQTVFVFAAPEVAEAYAGPQLTIRKFEAATDRTSPGDWILMTTRTNADQRAHVGDPTILSIGRLGATYCLLKEVPAG